jgi:hypothetical protein
MFRYLIASVPALLAAQEVAMNKLAVREIPPPPLPSVPQEMAHCYAAPDQLDRFYLAAQALYMTVAENGNEIATQKTYPVAGQQEAPGNAGSGSAFGAQGDLLEADFSWHPGVRGIIGYAFQQTPWYLEGDYSFLRADESQTYNAPTGSFAYLTALNFWQNINTGTTVRTINSRLDFFYHMARLNMGAGSTFAEKVRYCLYSGPVASWIGQNWTVRTVGSQGTVNENEIRWNFRGAGLNLGADLAFCFGAGFSMKFGGAVGALYGASDYEFRGMTMATATSSFSNQSNVNAYGKRRVLWTNQTFLEMTWGYRFRSATVELGAGYEFDGLYGINTQYRAVPPFTALNNQAHQAFFKNEAIFLHGLRATLGLAF